MPRTLLRYSLENLDKKEQEYYMAAASQQIPPGLPGNPRKGMK